MLISMSPGPFDYRSAAPDAEGRAYDPDGTGFVPKPALAPDGLDLSIAEDSSNCALLEGTGSICDSGVPECDESALSMTSLMSSSMKCKSPARIDC